MEHLLKKAFVDTRTKLYYRVSNTLAFFTVLSVVSIVLETVPSLTRYETIFLVIEWAAVIVFTIEYVARFYLSKPWYQYSFSFFGMIDLISILPTFLGLGNLTFLKSARIVRILRFLRMIRLTKLRRLKGSNVDHNTSVLMLNVLMYLTMLMVALVGFGVLLYVLESANQAFVSIPAAMWWVFGVFVNSSTASVPEGTLGGVLYVLVRFVGLLLLGAMVGMMANIFNHYLLDSKKR